MANNEDELFTFEDYLEDKPLRFPKADAFLKEYGLTISVVEDMKDHKHKFAIVFDNPGGKEDTSEVQIKKFLTDLLTKQSEKPQPPQISKLSQEAKDILGHRVGKFDSSEVGLSYEQVAEKITLIFGQCDTDRKNSVLLKDMKNNHVQKCTNFKTMASVIDIVIYPKGKNTPEIPTYIAVNGSGDGLRISDVPVIGFPITDVTHLPNGDIVLCYS